jgi:hypothetical protein
MNSEKGLLPAKPRMARLLIHVEGQTERRFVNEVLREYLVGKGYYSVEARLVGNVRSHQPRGGVRPWPPVRTGIVNHLKEDRECLATTMVDYYGLPQEWPGRSLAATCETSGQRGQYVQDALQNDLAEHMGDRFDRSRFVPFVVMHEFEGLLFSDCAAFSRGISRLDLETALGAIRGQFATPEEINDSPETAPSKRIETLFPGYQKPIFGVLAALEIGLSAIRAECPHFERWLSTLESRVR